MAGKLGRSGARFKGYTICRHAHFACSPTATAGLLVSEAEVKMGLAGRHLGTKVGLTLPGLRCWLRLRLLAANFAAFYFPGLVPITYCEEGSPNSYYKSSIQVYADKLYSMETVMTYDYDRFDFCQDSLKKTPSETLGQILFGEQVTICPYKGGMEKDNLMFTEESVKILAVSEVIDNMQVIWCYDREGGEHYCTSGFLIGCFNTPSGQLKAINLVNLPTFSKNNTLYLFNHVDITITYYIERDTTRDVVKLISSRVDPKSYKHSEEDHLTCNEPPLEISEENADNLNVVYTYSVKFEANVFRLPEQRMLLSVFLGQGTQVFIMTFCSLFLAGLGSFTPEDPTALVHYAVALWLLLEIPDGYMSAKMYKTFKGVNWKMHFLLTVLLFLGIVFADIFTMNLILWMEGSSAAVSFGTLASFIALCFGVAAPLTFLGMYFGKKEELDLPVHKQESSPVSPKRIFFTKRTTTVILGSLLPFGCFFLQVSYILNHSCYLFAVLLLVFLIFIISCSEVTVLLCYFRLCAEDCGWWWRTFLTSSFISVYIFIYALHYFFTKLQVTSIGSTIMYFGCKLVLALVLFLFTGTTGFFSSFCFITTDLSLHKLQQFKDGVDANPKPWI
ncbi:LOW QUALITY PROTEIN: transmembrane 9 superfamily member 2-like [Acomys russatus]|uniref:LOW QUALITY PROTEIN: transmembrane 9 superfamily member 2-like n=1 Tax=Acomys russatus TaxID=60746 RepID=UPI0021E2A7C8|nr:LOW QUALITY PROTEIN: transmembrane 9 superfamily member 2-like [Acomys russatus]